MKKNVTLLVLCCLSNCLRASSADETSNNYDQQKTEQLKKLIHDQYPHNMATIFTCVVKEMLRIPINYPQQILQLIEQGADPNAQDLLPQKNGAVYKGTALHVLCERSCYIKNFPEILAKLRFFKALDIQDHEKVTPRMLVWQGHSEDDLTAFDATIAATDIVRNMKKEETNNARLPLIQAHLSQDLAHTVNGFLDDAFWDATCWPAIQTTLAKNRNR